MKFGQLLFVAALAVTLAGCSTPKNVAYFQNAIDIRGMALQEQQPFRLRPEDKINIVVNSSDPLLTQQFNLISTTGSNRTLGTNLVPRAVSGNSAAGGSLLPYTVDSQGDILFPVLGKVAVAGKTRMEVAEYIEQRLIDRDLVRDPVVTVEYVNLGVTVLGEVNHPGRIDILKDHFTLLDALAAAGDLTISGERENVMVCREVDGEDQTYCVNLCDRQDLLESPAYYLQQNDVVYVTPNQRRLREYNAVGNTFNTPSFWLSLSTVLLSVVAIIL